MTIFESKDTYAQFQAKLSVDKTINKIAEIRAENYLGIVCLLF